MRVSDFDAEADLVGGRIRVRWDFVPDAGETLSSVPRIVVRRKQRDFEFPPVAAVDPFLVYDSGRFPPVPDAQTVVADLPGWQTRDAVSKTVVAVVSVA